LGNIELECDSFDLSALVQEVIASCEGEMRRAGCTLSIVSQRSAIGTWDRSRIEQVVSNLVHNAIKATEPGGSIYLEAHHEAGEIRITVRDTGIGIEPDDLGRLFERFYKVDRSRSSGGTGLGLAIAKHLTQAHGGRIWAESAGRGTGAIFTVALPVARVG